MVRVKERHLLVSVRLIDEAEGPPTVSAIHQSIRDAVHKHVSGLSSSIADGDAAAASIRTKHYSPQAQVVMVRVPLPESQRVREAIGMVKASQQRRVHLSIIRAFGNAVLARRALARRLHDALRGCEEAKSRKRLRTTLEQLAEAQKR